jgi:hypothetical protein
VSKLRNDCYDIINKILKKGEIDKENLMLALSFRMNIPIENCKISKFDEEMCKKCLKMLEKML